MNPTVLAMRRPVTTLMLVVALISGGALAYNRMRVDIFPALNVPKIYVFLDYIGMSPDQVEGFIVNQLELYFQYVDGIQDIDTRNIQQVALCQLSFFPGPTWARRWPRSWRCRAGRCRGCPRGRCRR